MEGALLAIALLMSVAALVVALAGMVMLVRAQRASPGDPLGGARYAALERRQVQLGRRLEVVEQDVDGSRDLETGVQGVVAASAPRRLRATEARIGLVRFDAFDDTGGGQSFALALIDDVGDGVVLTSLHARQASRLYVKDIRGGIADAALSNEEERALQKAGLEL